MLELVGATRALHNAQGVPTPEPEAVVGQAYGNTPVQSTGVLVPSRCGLDWLEYTCPATTPLGEAVPWLPFTAWKELGHGWNGYKRSYQAGGVFVACDGAEAMGVHVSVSSKGLTEFAATQTEFASLPLVSFVLKAGYKLSRLDWAIDIFDGSVVLADVLRCLRDGEVTTRYRKFRDVMVETVGKPEYHGRTVYVGTRKSDSMVRFYDKLAEVKERKGNVAKELGRVVDSWIRVEFEFHHASAQAFGLLVDGEAWAETRAVMLGLIAFRLPEAQRNKQRWAMAGWWVAALGASAVRSLGLVRPGVNVTRCRAWLARSVVASVASLLSGGVEYAAWWAEEVKRAMVHPSSRQRELRGQVALGFA